MTTLMRRVEPLSLRMTDMTAPTVRQLIDVLRKMPAEAQVILSCDAEGNGFHFLGEVGEYNSKNIILWPQHREVELED